MYRSSVNHWHASKEELVLSDLYGEHLIAVKSEDSLHLDNLLEMLKKTHHDLLYSSDITGESAQFLHILKGSTMKV